MFNTAKELHIGIDQGLQAINSNRKGNIEPSEKDWFLNLTMLELIADLINPKRNTRGSGFESDFEEVEFLDSLKVDTSEDFTTPIFRFDANSVFINVPPNLNRLISCSAKTRDYKHGSSVVNFKDYYSYPTAGTYAYRYCSCYSTVKFSDFAGDYSDLKIDFSWATDPAASDINLFDMASVIQYFSSIEEYENFGVNLPQAPYTDAKFQFISLILDYINRVSGVEYGIKVYWEKFNNFYSKDSFIFSIDANMFYTKVGVAATGLSIMDAKIFLSPDGNSYYTPGNFDIASSILPFSNLYGDRYLSFNPLSTADSAIFTSSQITAYSAASFSTYKARMAKTNEIEELRDHYYGKSIYNSPLGIMNNGRLLIYHDDTFEIESIYMKYYRKPRTISIYNNQGCEVADEDFRKLLVDKTIKKISAYIQDPNYQNIVNENLMLD